MGNWNPILDENKENSYITTLGNERRKKIPLYCACYILMIGFYLWGIIDVKNFSGILLFGSIFTLYEITNWIAIYHISSHQGCITLYLLDFWGRKSGFNLYQRDLGQVKLNHAFQSIQIPQYDVQVRVKEKQFERLVSLIQNLGSANQKIA